MLIKIKKKYSSIFVQFPFLKNSEKVSEQKSNRMEKIMLFYFIEFLYKMKCENPLILRLQRNYFVPK